AYNAAESGIQSAVHVLRDNITLADADRIDPTKPATDKANRIDFRKALKIETSNRIDPSLCTGPPDSQPVDCTPRLSRWLDYHDTEVDRVAIGSGTYDRRTGHAYSLSISDPDNTGNVVTFSTTGRLYDSDDGVPTRKTYTGSGGGSVTVQYNPINVTNLNVGDTSAITSLGTFNVAITSPGAPIEAFNRFEIIVTMTRPYYAVRVIRGYIETNSGAIGAPPKIIFDAQTHTLSGSQLTLDFDWGSPINQSIIGPPQRYGYEADMNIGDSNVRAQITSPEPKRLLIKSTGYGPRGSFKELEAIIQKDFFDGLTAPATLTLVGPDADANGGTFTFNPGSSSVTVY